MANFGLLIFVFFLSWALSLLLTPLIRKRALKKNIVSKPGRRRIHVKPVPFLGGLAMYFSFIVGILIVFYAHTQFRMEFAQRLQGLVIAGTLIVILGLWDDIKNIRPFTKLIGQLIVALVLFAYGFRIEVLTNPFSGTEMPIPLFLSALFTVGWVVGLINAMNLIDGIDGLAAGITVIVCGALLFIALYLGNYINVFLLAILAGSCLGFLRYNLPPAKIFMGDSGSMFLGLVLAAVGLIRFQYKSAVAVVLLTPIVALVVPIYDTFMAIVRRALKRESIFKADRKHLHHRLLDMGLTQKHIIASVYVVTLYLGIFAFLFVLIPKEYALILLVLLALGLFMGIKIVGFLERRVRHLQRLEAQKQKSEISHW
ncbi:MAG: undecaprenyl/decaprenyl-phosphate alpha-N-acetylglucosaminyl 1-phosphate transferase [Candidatus Omnitrophota bacterium]|nr:MAG: undecaprenyl/decaprenyl-phosphate alpha-N-acetylglucosaminyl 1-phosphate transferase [Candidatus Omnitrophota bacterium]